MPSPVSDTAASEQASRLDQLGEANGDERSFELQELRGGQAAVLATPVTPATPVRRPMTVDEARVWARVGVIAALALVLSYIETFIPLPVPVPGIKLGLANVAVLLALELMDVKSAALVAAVKVLAAGFLFGNPLMMLYSAGGTVLAFASMAALSRIRGLSVVFVAIVGAVLHNVGQLAVASVILGTPAVWVSAPILVVAACVTGALSGGATAYALSCLREDA